MFIYCELGVGRGIPGDAPVRPNTGNVTLQRQWDNTKPAGYSVPLTDSNSIKSLYAYDAWGNVSSTTDPNGNVSSFVVNGCSGATKSAYPTSVTVGGLTLAQTWDCSGGLLKTATDPNLVQTKRTYDNLGRTTLIQEAFGTLTERQTAIQYTEISTDIGGSLPLTVTTKSDLAAKADQLLVTTKKFDQRGQIAESVQPDGSITRHLSPVAFSWESFTYEAVSNPYVSGTESTAGWTLTWRDQLGRVSRTSHYSGSDLPYPWGNNTASSGSTTSVYNGYSTISQDENNRSRQVIVDAQGRLKTVVEDQRNSGYATTYTYDGLDNLTGVNQGGLPHKR